MHVAQLLHTLAFAPHHKIKFSPGSLYITPGALEAFKACGDDVTVYLIRHISEDWGEVDEHNRRENELSLPARLADSFLLSTPYWCKNLDYHRSGQVKHLLHAAGGVLRRPPLLYPSGKILRFRTAFQCEDFRNAAIKILGEAVLPESQYGPAICAVELRDGAVPLLIPAYLLVPKLHI